jgi:transposase
MEKFLSKKQRNELLSEHRLEKDKHFADRLKTILLLDEGLSYKEISRVLFLNDSTIRRYEKNYLDGGIECLLTDNYKGGFGFLSPRQEEELKNHLAENTFLSCKEVMSYIKAEYKINYSIGGVLHLLKRLGFVYKKPKQIPGKSDKKAQEEFVDQYSELLENKGDNDPIYFMDGTHPHHNPIPSYGWILKGEEKELKTNTGRARININGAINTETLDVAFRFDERINAESTIELFKDIEKRNPKADTVYVIADNARYYRARKVNEYLQGSKIEILFLPPYSPNLNLIERFWKFFKKKVLYNKYYEKFDIFRDTCMRFFNDIVRYKNELRSLLTDNFQIIGS